MSDNVVSFQDGAAARYARNVILSYLNDPPDSEFQEGYLAAMLDLYRQELEKGQDDDRIKFAARMVYPDEHHSE